MTDEQRRHCDAGRSHGSAMPPKDPRHRSIGVDHQHQHEPHRDRLFARTDVTRGSFAFDTAVADVFDDMIRRSVPGYGQIIDLAALAAPRFFVPGSHCYDLGASLGGCTLAMADALAGTDARLVAVDNAPPMTQRLRQRLAADPPKVPVEVVDADIQALDLAPSSFVTMVFTMQFLEPSARAPLLERLRAALLPGGAMLLAEKIVADEHACDALLRGLHEDFKRTQGYTELEIAGKRAAIEQVLMPESLAVHRERLVEAGFDTVVECARTLNFAALLAIAR